jgi:hypothetical protein
MQNEKYDLLKLAGVCVIIFCISTLSIDSTANGIHMHDSYFIMSKVMKFLIFVVISLFIGSLVVSIFTRFKNKLYVKIFIFSAFLLFSGWIYIFSLFGYGR